MAYRVAQNTLNASTIDILNVIRQNASYDYQQNVPVVATAADIPHVGDVIYGTPAFANQFINALVNRIALVRAKSATFNNPYARLKKGYLEFGETVEEIFVQIAKVVKFDPEKAAAREFKRTLPDVRSAFHVMNWRVMYPVTIQDEDLKRAFLSMSGVQELIAKIVDSVYKAAEYDEFLLFKYLLIKGISAGRLKPISIDTTDTKNAAKKFRGMSNKLTFMSSENNEAGVTTATPREDQAIFMDAMFNAEYDVDVLAAAFNMDKADFMGRLYLIDDFASFDNDRFAEIRANSDGLEEVTTEELALMTDVKAVLLDEEWFQVYDNNTKFTEQYAAAGLYWNYFYHTWKTISISPFSNAVVFVDSSANIALPATITVEVADKSISEEATVLTLIPQVDAATLAPHDCLFTQTNAATTAGIAIQKFGAMLIPASKAATKLTLELTVQGTKYTAQATVDASAAVGTTITFKK